MAQGGSGAGFCSSPRDYLVEASVGASSEHSQPVCDWADVGIGIRTAIGTRSQQCGGSEASARQAATPSRGAAMLQAPQASERSRAPRSPSPSQTFQDSEPWMAYSSPRHTLCRAAISPRRLQEGPLSTYQLSEPWTAYSSPPRGISQERLAGKVTELRTSPRSVSPPRLVSQLSEPRLAHGPGQSGKRSARCSRSPSPTYCLSDSWMLNSSPQPWVAASTPRFARRQEVAFQRSNRSKSPTFNVSSDWMQYSSPSQEAAPEAYVPQRRRPSSCNPSVPGSAACRTEQRRMKRCSPQIELSSFA